MARIKNETLYPRDTNITGQEIVIGSDVGGTTLNYTIDELAEYIGGENVIRTKITITATGSGLAAAVVAFNNSSLLTVAKEDIIAVKVQREEIVTTDLRIDIKIWRDHYWLIETGKGTYCSGGTITITEDNLLYRRSDEVYTVETINNLPPVVYELKTLDTDTVPENVLNTTTILGGYLIDSDADYFFLIREVEGLIFPPIYTGNIKYYRFVGANGTYGNGFTASVNADFVLLSGNVIEDTTNSFLTLDDVIDNTFEGTVGWAPIVYENNVTEPPTYKLKLQPVITPSNLNRANAPIDFGVSFIQGFEYFVFCSTYIINQVDYNLYADKFITLTNGDASFNRIDLIILRLDLNLSNPIITVLEGTPSADPVEPSIDLTREVLISRRNILANAIVDPDATIDLIYDENVEWSNLGTSPSINLTDNVNPSSGTLSINIPETLPNTFPKTISWDRGSLDTYIRENAVIFSIRNHAASFRSTVFEFKLTNSVNGGSFIKTASLFQMQNYGFNIRSLDWQIINIPLSVFISDNSNNLEYDGFSISFSNNSEINIDRIYIQGGVPTEQQGFYVKEIFTQGGGASVDATDPERPIIILPTLVASTGLEKITEGSNTGWRLIGKDPANYANIGNEAVDFSHSSSPSTTKGAFGRYSFAAGYNNSAGNYGSATGWNNIAGDYGFATGLNNSTGTAGFAMGDANSVSGQWGFATGQLNTITAFTGATFGYYNTSALDAEFVVGRFSTVKTYVDYDTDRIFNVGVGYASPGTVRRDGLSVFSQGVVTAPTLTIALIDAEATGKALITKEYGDANYLGTGDVTKVGTPVNAEMPYWTGDGTLASTPNMLFDGYGYTVSDSGENTNTYFGAYGFSLYKDGNYNDYLDLTYDELRFNNASGSMSYYTAVNTRIKDATVGNGFVEINPTSITINNNNPVGGTIFELDGLNDATPATIQIPANTNGRLALKDLGYTVATLPAGTVGDRAYVTDATAPTFLGSLTGGGAVKCPVWHNGTAWVSA